MKLKKNDFFHSPPPLLKLTFLLLLGIFSLSTIQAQMVEVKGTVLDETQLPLPGVNIQIKGTSEGTATDVDGKFVLNVSTGSVLVFTFTGYATQESTINGDAELVITMNTDTELLDEVVVVGYGQTQNKRSTTTAVSTIDARQIQELRTSRPETALQGTAPGIIVTQTSGSPGAPLTVRMRGVGSPNASTPLYLVNGVQVPNLEFLNAGDIASVTLLKDAASAAIYGSRGGNGAVLVETVKGNRFADKPRISLSGFYGLQNLGYKPELMDRDQYIDYYNNAVNSFEPPTGFRPAFTDQERNALPNTDWYDVIFDDNVPMGNIHLSLADGNERMDYSISGGIFTQDGLVGGEADKSNYERRNVRANFNTDLASNLKLSVNADYSNVSRNFLIENSGGTGTALMNYITAIPAIYPTRAANGELFNMGRQNPNPSFNGVPLNVLGAVTNPLWSIEITNNEAVQNVLLLSGSLSYQPIDRLNIRGSYSFYDLSALNRSFTPNLNYPEQAFTTSGFVSYSEAPTDVENRQYNLTVDYTFGNSAQGHSLNVLGGFEVIETYANVGGQLSNAGDYLVNNFDDVNFALAADISNAILTPGIESEIGLLSFFGRVNYNYKDRYLFSASLRNDQSSNFGENNRSGIFPAASLGWLLSEESFFNADWVDLVKIRASWGINGSDGAAPYSYLATVTTNAQYSGNTGITQTGLANPNLKWEELTQTNIGLDINMFNNAFGLTIDYYNKETSDILLRANTPLSTGLNPSFVNVGDVTNTGVEVFHSCYIQLPKRCSI
ncbi:MAG: SusC/RagA family TonB-linked outer membrane protein [Bacteroidota bacterium]